MTSNEPPNRQKALATQNKLSAKNNTIARRGRRHVKSTSKVAGVRYFGSFCSYRNLFSFFGKPFLLALDGKFAT
jgi:hypothetical protein